MLQLQVQNSPFNQEQVELLNKVLPTLSDMQQFWLSGFLSAFNGNVGVLAEGNLALSETSGTEPAVTKEVTVLYGSQTGNCQTLSEELAEKLKQNGYKANAVCMSEFKPNQLKKLSFLLIVVSTHGEGDPPDTAISFHEFLHGRRAPKLEDLHYSVLSLGDSSYDFFCETGKQFDERLAELGGKRISNRVDCDLDFDDPAEEWYQAVQDKLNELTAVQTTSGNIGTVSTPHLKLVESSSYSRKNPFKAEVLENLNLNGRGSNKETRHLELLLEGSNFEFEPGDSLGIYPENDETLVNKIISYFNWDPKTNITLEKEEESITLFEALRNYYEITVLSKPLIEKLVVFNKSEKLLDLLAPENVDVLKEYIYGRDLFDLISDYPDWDTAPEQFVKNLRKLPPRLYSIASSYNANPDEVHLTIGTVRYEAHGRKRSGVCSVQCAERIEPGDVLPVYVHRNPNFRLPKEQDTPIIMIGPGTGVAPFRSFLEERETFEATGKSWLFFGDQHFVTDFLYQTDWQRWLKSGVLTKMDVAFSRDQDEKVYVQHRMSENAKELYNWIEEGAYIYICGDEKHMAKDVQNTLISILESEGQMSKEEAIEYLNTLQKEKRYQRDIY